MSPEAAAVARLLLVALLPAAAAAAAASQVMGQQQQLLPGEILGGKCFASHVVKTNNCSDVWIVRSMHMLLMYTGANPFWGYLGKAASERPSKVDYVRTEEDHSKKQNPNMPQFSLFVPAPVVAAQSPVK